MESVKEFKKLGLSDKILGALKEMKFVEPTPIQKATIPIILQGEDVIGNASTGSGKTLAFASGIIEKCVPGKGIQALVLAPTRELVEQITKVMREFAEKTQLNIQEIYGGVSISRQITESKYADVIIGTPGRILDHLQRKTFDFFDLKILVLDEADRMVDMGFLKDMEKILWQCPKKRQTLLFSATSSNDTDYIEKKYMISPKQISVEKYVDAGHLKHYYYDVPGHLKFSLLVHLLKQEKSGRIMVFCNTRKNVDLISMNLMRYGVNSHSLHGGLEQKKRSRIMSSFHDREAEILVCTDVAARGIDVEGVSHVYNYDIPKTSEEYIHRVGRTARAGKTGMAVSIVSSYDYENFNKVNMDDSLNIEQKELPKIESLNPRFDNSKTYVEKQRTFREGQEKRRFFGKRKPYGRSSGGNSRPSGRSQGRSFSSSGDQRRSSSSGGNQGRSYGRSQKRRY
ncbi:MAG: DEAD/DEAH box helicase [Nanoarchaeota archaeon]